MICKQEKSKKKKNEGLWEISEIVLSGRAERRVPFSTFFEVSVQRQCRRYRDTTCKVVWLLFFFFSGTVQIFSFMSRKQKKKKNVQISWPANALIFAQPTPHLHPSVYQQSSSSTHMVPGSWQNYQSRCLPCSFLRSHHPRTGLSA